MALDPLSTQVFDRYGGATSQYLAGLTNPFTPDGAPAIDDDQLNRAATDVIAALAIYGNLVYDDTDPLHVEACVPAVITKLKLYTGQWANAESEWEQRRLAFIALAKVTARNRFLVQTDSGTTKSDENPNGDIVRPPFDDQMFDRYIPNQFPQAPGPLGNGQTP